MPRPNAIRKPLRRTDELPRFAEAEVHARRRYPRSLELGDTGLTLKWRDSRIQHVADNEDAIHRRTRFVWLHRDNRRVGAMEFATFDPTGCDDNDEFDLLMDADDGHEAEMAVALTTCWQDVILDLASFGPILEFRSAWLAREVAYGRNFDLAANTMINDFGRHRSILIMKAFPLEYEGNASSPEISAALDHRQRAMVRYYRKIFGVAPLPGEYGRQGWLWAAHPQKKLTHPRVARSSNTTANWSPSQHPRSFDRRRRGG